MWSTRNGRKNDRSESRTAAPQGRRMQPTKHKKKRGDARLRHGSGRGNCRKRVGGNRGRTHGVVRGRECVWEQERGGAGVEGVRVCRMKNRNCQITRGHPEGRAAGSVGSECRGRLATTPAVKGGRLGQRESPLKRKNLSIRSAQDDGRSQYGTWAEENKNLVFRSGR